MMKRVSPKDIIRRARKIKPFIARDGSLIFELLRPVNSPVKNMSIAAGCLRPTQKALPHFHRRSEEVYYILSGSGRVRVGKREYRIQRGDAVYIAPRNTHALENTSRKKRLEILAISSPAYSDRDIFFV